VKLLHALRTRKWRFATIGLALVLLLSASGIASWPDQVRGMRFANRQDELFRYVAQELAEPALCERIPWSVMVPGGFFIAPSYERSDCYDFIAGRTKNPRPCWKVRRLGTMALISDQTSMWSCLRNAWRGRNGGMAVPPESLVEFFTKLGYDPDTLHLEGITPPVVNLRDIYMLLPKRPDLITRIEQATRASRSQPDLAEKDATNAAYLDDMAALVSEDLSWCARISEDVELPRQSAGFRDWCFFTFASNTKNVAACTRIPIRPGETDPRLSLQANCNRQANSSYPLGHYGPEVPPDDDRIRALMALLDYPTPRANDMPAETVYAAYQRFLQELNKQTDERHAEARRRFIARVQQLPAGA
jgi:hypothetical protein